MKGFTLIELLIVLAISIALATIGAVNFVNYRNKQDVDLTVREIVAILRNAQDRTIAQESGSRFGVHFDNTNSNSGFYTLFMGTTYVSGISINRVPLRNSIQFTSPSNGTSTDVIFAPISGLPVASTSIIIFSRTNALQSSTINVNSNGQIQY
ncbi:prepilin-type N-terminal cleavage/methylation domain-containing protein [Candidatus Wolfebacteria bacterium]|nr:prepilin-type N-terminal cleavage/methylation domain-containing protein [Candidatus Wolfebacteria bacterium]